MKEINPETGSICPICKEGRVALGSQISSYVEFDQEPYTNGVKERDMEDFTLNDNVNLSITFCDNCGEIFFSRQEYNEHKCKDTKTTHGDT